MRTLAASWVFLLTLQTTSGCSKCSGTEPSGSGEAPTASEPSASDAACNILSEKRLGDTVALQAGLTSRRLSDGRLAVGVGVGGEPRAVTVDAAGAIALQNLRRKRATPGELLRITPALEGSELWAFTDVRSADGHVDCAAGDSSALSDCRSFASADAKTTWLVGAKREGDGPHRLVVKHGDGPERELFTSQPDAFEDLRSEALGEKGYVISARYGGRVVLLRLKPDFELIEARSYGTSFGKSPELVSAGSGALLLTTRRAFGEQRLVFTQFEDAHGRLPVDFSGSDHGFSGLSPRLATAGSQRYLTLLSNSSPGRLELVPVGPNFNVVGRAQFVVGAKVHVVDAAAVGLDDGRVVVVFATAEKELHATTLRCKPGQK